MEPNETELELDENLNESTSVRETDDIFKKYNSGESTIDETNAALKDANANFHLEPLSDEERLAKKQREDESGYIPNPNPVKHLPKKVDLRRRLDLIGTPRHMREIEQKTLQGTFIVHYDDQGYAIRATKIS